MAQPSSLFQSLYRTVVMVGTLGVGSMAAYQYGPPLEKLADLINQGVERIAEMRAGESAPVVDKVAVEPPPWATTADAAAPPFTDPPIETASAFLPPEPKTTGEGAALLPEAGLLEAGLLEAGATEATVKPWGIQGKIYRAAASMPVGATGMTRQFDAIAETPEQATQDVLAQVRAAR